MKQIRIHGRGGQGIAVMAEMVTMAFVLDGKESTSFPMFGSERRGGPVTAFVRFGDEPILEKTKVYEPDCLILLDSSLINSPTIFDGVKEDSILVINSKIGVKSKLDNRIKTIGSVDADKICTVELGRKIPNTCLMGAFAASTQWLNLGSVLQCLEEYFPNETLVANKACATKGFKEVKIERY
jgi:2-oxoacid:acceptor oxidoreductase gamma subunit (pyruvate/2-ketoisovalerate family)